MEWFESAVRVNDADFDYKMKADSVLYFLIDSSGARNFANQKEKLERIKDGPYLFYLLRWDVEIFRRPFLAEPLRGKDWVCGISFPAEGTLSYRCVEMYGADGDVCARGIMTVAVIDRATGKRVCLTEEEAAQLPELATGAAVPVPATEKEIPFVFEAFTAGNPFPVRRSDIDLYSHVNNGKYVTMALDCLPAHFVPGRMRVQYKHAAKLGDVIYPRLLQAEDGCTVALCSEKQKPFALVQFIK